MRRQRLAAQSVYAPDYVRELALDGDPDPYAAWISAPYGGGTKQKPKDVWWAINFPKDVRIKGVKKVGDNRQAIPVLKNFQIQVADGKNWKTVDQVKDATTKTTTTLFDAVVETKGIRIFVSANDLPSSENLSVDGIVRICELLLIMPDGTEEMLKDVFDKK